MIIYVVSRKPGISNAESGESEKAKSKRVKTGLGHRLTITDATLKLMNEVKLFNPGFLDRQQVSVGDEGIEYIEGSYKKDSQAETDYA